jgi:4'-phosphopantetheinyl transferase
VIPADDPSLRVVLLKFEDGTPRLADTLSQLVADVCDHASAVPATLDAAPPVICATVDPRSYWDEALGTLGPAEAKRATCLRLQARRQAYVYAHASLRLLLARVVGDKTAASMAFSEGPKGKPGLAGDEGDIHFSISYRDGYAALALGSAPLGIDIELLQDGIDMGAIADRYFTAHERAYLAAAAQSDRGPVFFKLWTRKEALVKAAGVGIDKLAVASGLERVASLADDHGKLQRYCVHDLAVSADLAMALAIRLGAKGNWQ